MIIITHCFICGVRGTEAYSDEHINYSLFKLFPEKDNDYYGPHISCCNNEKCSEELTELIVDCEIRENNHSVYEWREPCHPYNIIRSNGSIDTDGRILKDEGYYQNRLNTLKMRFPVKWTSNGDEYSKLITLENMAKKYDPFFK